MASNTQFVDPWLNDPDTTGEKDQQDKIHYVHAKYNRPLQLCGVQRFCNKTQAI
jgi:hypothetical protein